MKEIGPAALDASLAHLFKFATEFFIKKTKLVIRSRIFVHHSLMKTPTVAVISLCCYGFIVTGPVLLWFQMPHLAGVFVQQSVRLGAEDPVRGDV